MGRGAAVPLYQQIYSQLREEIMSGARPFGSQVPTEQEITTSYNVSRTTAKLALNKLAEQKLIARKRKVGSRVIFKALTQPVVSNISSTMDSLTSSHHETYTKVLKIGSETASELASAILEIEAGAPILRIDLLRWLDSTPLDFTEAYLPQSVSDKLALDDLGKTPLISQLMASGFVVGAAKQTIAAILADPGTASFLEMHPMQPLLRITRSYRSTDGSPLMLTRAFYRADRYQADVDLAAYRVET